MSAFARIFKPLHQAATAFFQHDLTLRRADGGLRLVFELRSADDGAGAVGTGKQPSRAQLQADKNRQELALIQAQLTDLLDSVPETRGTMRHLVFVEHALARKGLQALHKLPLDVLQQALEQIEGLVTNWSPAGLASLRSKMAVAIIDRQHMDPDAEADANRTAAVLEHAADAAGLRDAAAAVPGTADAQREDAALAAAYAALGAAAPAADVALTL